MFPRVKKEENGEEEVKKPKLDGREVYKKQNQLLYKYRDTLKPLNRNEYALIFEYNGQKVPVGDEVVSCFSKAYKAPPTSNFNV